MTELNHKTNLTFPEESHKIIGAAMAVHRYFGCGFSEKVYQDALEVEFKNQGIPYSVNYNENTDSFINNINIMGDWGDPMGQLKQVFDTVKNSKPDLYKDVQFEN